jgi:hypothetical protein
VQKSHQLSPWIQVDVVMSSPGSSASPFDFLARFAGPIAWLIAGLLLLFGGLCLGGAGGAATGHPAPRTAEDGKNQGNLWENIGKTLGKW